MSDGGKGDARRPTLVSRKVEAERWLRTFGATFPCATCEGYGTIAVAPRGCSHMRGPCPCGSVEIACEDCIEGARVCQMCGERAAVHVGRDGDLLCEVCAVEEAEEAKEG